MAAELLARVSRWRDQVKPVFWTGDLRSTRIVRFSLGVTLAVAIAFAIEWPLSFLTPVLTAVVLAMPLPGPTFNRVLLNIGYLLGAFALGLVFTLFLLPYPLAYTAVLGLTLFHIYYLLNRGGPFMMVLMSLLAVLILPMLAQAHDVVASGFAAGFVASGGFFVVLVWVMHQLIPDPPDAPGLPISAGFQPGFSPVAAQAALKSTMVVLPITVLFIVMQWSGEILVMVFVAIFSLSPQLRKGRAAGLKSLTSTIAGGIAALLFFHILVVVPEYHFFVALMLLTALWFGANIFSGKPNAPYYPSAFTALLVLVSTSMGEGSDITEKFILRVLFIALATVYVVVALMVLDRFWPRLRNEPS